MNFLGIGALEFLLILIIAFIFVGPERLVGLAGTLGRWVNQFRRMTSEMTGPISELRTELDEIKADVEAPVEEMQAELTDLKSDLEAPLQEATTEVSQMGSEIRDAVRVGSPSNSAGARASHLGDGPIPVVVDREVETSVTEEQTGQSTDEDGPVPFRPESQPTHSDGARTKEKGRDTAMNKDAGSTSGDS